MGKFGINTNITGIHDEFWSLLLLISQRFGNYNSLWIWILKFSYSNSFTCGLCLSFLHFQTRSLKYLKIEILVHVYFLLLSYPLFHWSLRLRQCTLSTIFLHSFFQRLQFAFYFLFLGKRIKLSFFVLITNSDFISMKEGFFGLALFITLTLELNFHYLNKVF